MKLLFTFQILTTEDENAITAQVVLNNLEGESQKPDMDVNVRMGGTKIVFVNWFVTNLLVRFDNEKMNNIFKQSRFVFRTF